MPSRSLGHRAPLLWLVLPLAAGLIAGRAWDFGAVGVQLAVAAMAALIALIASRSERRGRAWPAAITVALFLAGSASYTLHRQRLAAWDGLPPREVHASIRVARTFAQANPGKCSGIGVLTAVTAPLGDLAGQRVYFSVRLAPGQTAPLRESVIAVHGVVTPLPPNPAPNTFDGYLASSGVNFRVDRARLLHEERPPPAYYRFCNAASVRFNAILGEGIARKRPELAGLLRAMMLGETSELTADQHTIFMQSGTMHLFAISGLNIAVIAGAVDALLRLARLRAWARFVVGATLLWLFVDITGGSPSAVRAFAMALFFQAAFVLRRPANALAAVVGSAAVVLVAAPLQLFSASFLMSYAIVFVLLTLGLPLSEAWLAKPTPWSYLPRPTWSRWLRAVDAAWRWLAAAVAIGLATTLVSLLTSVQFFNLLTPGALIANLVLIPAAMVVTLGGFAALVCGLAGFTAGVVLCNHASALVLLVIEALVRAGVRLPWAFVPAHFRAPWIGGTVLALLVVVVIAGYASGWSKERGHWWPPFAVVAVALLVGVQFG